LDGCGRRFADEETTAGVEASAPLVRRLEVGRDPAFIGFAGFLVTARLFELPKALWAGVVWAGRYADQPAGRLPVYGWPQWLRQVDPADEAW
jgi:hypothetical protein